MDCQVPTSAKTTLTWVIGQAHVSRCAQVAQSVPAQQKNSRWTFGHMSTKPRSGKTQIWPRSASCPQKFPDHCLSRPHIGDLHVLLGGIVGCPEAVSPLAPNPHTLPEDLGRMTFETAGRYLPSWQAHSRRTLTIDPPQPIQALSTSMFAEPPPGSWTSPPSGPQQGHRVCSLEAVRVSAARARRKGKRQTGLTTRLTESFS